MDPLSMHGFVVSHIGHLESTGSLSYEDPRNGDSFQDNTISKKISYSFDTISRLISSEKPKY